MFNKVYHATHPDMMDGVENEKLRERYVVSDLFAADAVNLNYSHNERMVIGGAMPVKSAVALPAQTEPESAKGNPFLERRELGIINVGEGSGTISVDGETHPLASRTHVMKSPRFPSTRPCRLSADRSPKATSVRSTSSSCQPR